MQGVWKTRKSGSGKRSGSGSGSGSGTGKINECFKLLPSLHSRDG